VLLIAVTGGLLTDPASSRSDALKTGGLAGGAVVALYALWLNDRRRRVEEGRQKIEKQRHDLEMLRTDRDRDRIDLYNTMVAPDRDSELPPDWEREKLPDGRARLVMPGR
jgi:hypothetical protein